MGASPSPLEVTAPLAVRFPDGRRQAVIACFPHPRGLLVFSPFWTEHPGGVAVLEGEIRGDGPWRVGDAVLSVAGCHGTDPQIAADLAAWRDHVAAHPDPDALRAAVLAEAERLGARETAAP